MPNKVSASYKDSGVNIDEGNRFVQIIKNMVESTHNSSVIGGLGGFAGFFDISNFKDMKEPVLVSSTDGVGTKLKVAIDSEIYNTVGIDLVAMSVNDLIVTGAKPLFFLDYIATGKLSSETMKEVVSGIVEGCKQSGAALLGGETAEMPDMYSKGDFDLAGFAVGIVDKAKSVDGKSIKAGDRMVGLASSGFHSNGYSLLRKIFFKELNLSPKDTLNGFGKVGELLLTPTKIYVKTVLAALDVVPIKGMVHITGGGFYDNIPRVLPKGLGANIVKERFPVVKPVEALRSVSNIQEKELYRVFNMGIGYVFIVSPENVSTLIDLCEKHGEQAREIGEIVSSDSGDIRIKDIDY